MPPARRSDLAFNRPSGMHIFEGRYFNNNRKFLMCLGLWPYEAKVRKIALRTIFIGAMVLLIVPELISLKVHHKNMDRLMLNVVMALSMFLITLKGVGMIIAEKNMIKLFTSIANNWQLIQDQSERDIIHEYSERARTVTIFYATAILTLAVIASTLPLLPKLLDELDPLENPRPNIDVLGTEYLIDRSSHFVPLFFFEQLLIILASFIVVTVDTIYIVTVEHCCMLFKILRCRLVELKRIVQKNSSSDEDVDSYEWLRRTIELHQDALTFTSLVKDSYSAGFLFMVIAGLIICPLNCCAVIANLDKPLQLIPYAACYLGIMVQGFSIFYPGQRVIDHQLRLCDAAYCNEWYVTPRRTRKLLLIFMLRCTKPTIISAGGLLEINFEVYFMLLKTTLSYVTVAWSFR